MHSLAFLCSPNRRMCRTVGDPVTGEWCCLAARNAPPTQLKLASKQRIELAK